jgi:dolichol kinase
MPGALGMQRQRLSASVLENIKSDGNIWMVKSAEGSTAMYVLSFVTVCIILMCRGGMDLAEYILISAIVAFVSMLAELYSKNGIDTIICPVCAMFALLFMLYVTGGLV